VQDARHVEATVAEQPLDLQAVHERDQLPRGRGGRVAPGAIGGIARLSSLTMSFALVVLLTAAIAAGAGTLRPAADT
jgi:hypothetical protein